MVTLTMSPFFFSISFGNYGIDLYNIYVSQTIKRNNRIWKRRRRLLAIASGWMM